MQHQKSFYFFIETEFLCRRNCDLMDNDDQITDFSKYALTINLVKFDSYSTVNNYKIYYKISSEPLDKNQMKKLYETAYVYINQNFIRNNHKDIFLGCVRDDNSSHEYCTYEKLRFINRTDPIHDIFNALKMIYCLKNGSKTKFQSIQFKDGKVKKTCRLNDLKDFLNKLPKSSTSSLPVVGYYDLNSENTVDNRRIWIPNKNSAKLELFIDPLRYLFKINYYETIMEILKLKKKKTKSDKKVIILLDFILLLKSIFDGLNEIINNKDKIQRYKDMLSILSKYSFKEKYKTRCLKSLADSMQCNADLIANHGVFLKPIVLSTQMIEAEKGHLRYNACNGIPLVLTCDDWFQKARDDIVFINACSEFGDNNIKFDPLPVKPMNFNG